MKKIALFLILLVGFSVGSFAESFYSLSVGFFRLNEQFFGEEYGREVDGLFFSTDITYFPAKSSWGWYINVSAGGGLSGIEWTENKMSALDFSSTTNLRLSGGPSYKVIKGSTFVFPVSLGPVFSNYREENFVYDDNDEYNRLINESMNIGLLADAAIYLTPLKWFTFKTGISLVWDFVRFERGDIQRHNNNAYYGAFNYVDYMAFNIGLYSGIGIRF